MLENFYVIPLNDSSVGQDSLVQPCWIDRPYFL